MTTMSWPESARKWMSFSREPPPFSQAKLQPSMLTATSPAPAAGLTGTRTISSACKRGDSKKGACRIGAITKGYGRESACKKITAEKVPVEKVPVDMIMVEEVPVEKVTVENVAVEKVPRFSTGPPHSPKCRAPSPLHRMCDLLCKSLTTAA